MHHSLMATQIYSVHSELKVPVSCSSYWRYCRSVTFQGIPILEDEMETGTLEFQDAKNHWETHETAKKGFRVSVRCGSIDLEMAS
jgi:hypothetical protein